MAVVSVAIVISFHLKSQPSPLERRIALPLGLIFWLLALVCLCLGLANYVSTVTRYSRRQALVQSGWKTQAVRRPGVRLGRHADPAGVYRRRLGHRRRVHPVPGDQVAAAALSGGCGPALSCDRIASVARRSGVGVWAFDSTCTHHATS